MRSTTLKDCVPALLLNKTTLLRQLWAVFTATSRSKKSARKFKKLKLRNLRPRTSLHWKKRGKEVSTLRTARLISSSNCLMGTASTSLSKRKLNLSTVLNSKTTLSWMPLLTNLATWTTVTHWLVISTSLKLSAQAITTRWRVVECWRPPCLLLVTKKERKSKKLPPKKPPPLQSPGVNNTAESLTTLNFKPWWPKTQQCLSCTKTPSIW